MKRIVYIILTTILVILGQAKTLQAAVVVYDNSANDLNTRFNTGLSEVGDEIILDGGATTITKFVIQYWGLNFSGDETMQVRIYKNDGADWDAVYKLPGTKIFDSGAFTIGSTTRSTLTFDSDFGAGLDVPGRFTWTVQYSGINAGAGESAGLDLYSPPTVGSNFSDYWVNSSPWELRTSPGTSMDFAATIQAVPEPSQYFVVFGIMCMACISRRWRKAGNV